MLLFVSLMHQLVVILTGFMGAGSPTVYKEQKLLHCDKIFVFQMTNAKKERQRGLPSVKGPSIEFLTYQIRISNFDETNI